MFTYFSSFSHHFFDYRASFNKKRHFKAHIIYFSIEAFWLSFLKTRCADAIDGGRILLLYFSPPHERYPAGQALPAATH